MEDEMCDHCGKPLEGVNRLKIIYLRLVSGASGIYCSIDCCSHARTRPGWIYYGILALVFSFVLGQGIFYDSLVMVLMGYVALFGLVPIGIINLYLSVHNIWGKRTDSQLLRDEASPAEIREAFTPGKPLNRAIPIQVPQPIKVRDYLLQKGLSTEQCTITHLRRVVNEDTILEPEVVYILICTDIRPLLR